MVISTRRGPVLLFSLVTPREGDGGEGRSYRCVGYEVTFFYQNFKYSGNTSSICRGNFVMPGFNDAHMPDRNWIQNSPLNLTGSRSLEEFATPIRKRIEYRHPRNGSLSFRLGMETLWPVKEPPRVGTIDGSTTELPVFRVRIDGMVAVANTLDAENGARDPGKTSYPKAAKLAAILLNRRMDTLRETAPSMVRPIPAAPAYSDVRRLPCSARYRQLGVTFSSRTIVRLSSAGHWQKFQIFEQLERGSQADRAHFGFAPFGRFLLRS